MICSLQSNQLDIKFFYNNDTPSSFPERSNQQHSSPSVTKESCIYLYSEGEHRWLAGATFFFFFFFYSADLLFFDAFGSSNGDQIIWTHNRQLAFIQVSDLQMSDMQNLPK